MLFVATTICIPQLLICWCHSILAWVFTPSHHMSDFVYNSIQIQLWARTKSTHSPRIHSKVVSHSQTHVVLLTVMFMVFSLLGQFFATWQPKIWVNFCEKNAKVARFWGIFLINCYFWTISSSRSPKYSRIFKKFYFPLWPLVKFG